MNEKQIEMFLSCAKENPNNIKFKELIKVCEHFFGAARQNSTSHRVYKTPWPGDPRVNLQKSENGKAKVYQVKQVIVAIKKLKEVHHGKP